MDPADIGQPEHVQTKEEGLSRSAFLKRTAAVGAGAGVMSAALAACGGGSAKSSTTTSSSDTTATAPAGVGGGSIASKYKGKKIGVVHLTEADENETTLVKALQEASARAGLGWTFLQADSQGDPGKAQAAVESFVTQKVDAIIPLVVAARLVNTQLNDAQKAGIPVFGEWTFSELSPNINIDYTSVPAADASALAGYMCDDLYIKHPSGAIKVALVNTDLDILKPRNAVVRALAALFPRVQIVDSASIDLTNIVGSSTNIANGFLSKYSDLNALWASYPLAGSTAATAVQAAGKASQVPVYTHVAESVGLKELADPHSPLEAMPWLDFDWQSYHLVGYMLDHFAGTQLDRLSSYEVIVPFQVFNKRTVTTGATGKGVAAGHGWTLLDGVWKQPLIDSWKQTFSS